MIIIEPYFNLNTAYPKLRNKHKQLLENLINNRELLSCCFAWLRDPAGLIYRSDTFLPGLILAHVKCYFF